MTEFETMEIVVDTDDIVTAFENVYGNDRGGRDVIRFYPPFDGECVGEYHHLPEEQIGEERDEFDVGPAVFCDDGYSDELKGDRSRAEWENIVHEARLDTVTLTLDGDPVPVTYNN